jgi:hypothetical protein
MMSISFSQLFPRSNPGSPLSWANTLQSPVLCSREKIFLVDVGPGTLIIHMRVDLTRVSINVTYIIFRDGSTYNTLRLILLTYNMLRLTFLFIIH